MALYKYVYDYDYDYDYDNSLLIRPTNLFVFLHCAHVYMFFLI